MSVCVTDSRVPCQLNLFIMWEFCPDDLLPARLPILFVPPSGRVPPCRNITLDELDSPPQRRRAPKLNRLVACAAAKRPGATPSRSPKVS